MGERIIAIDPGNEYSAYVIVDTDDFRPVEGAKVENGEMLERLVSAVQGEVSAVTVEMVESYGMAVGKTVFETCVWIGRFVQLAITAAALDIPVRLIHRGTVKKHLCMSRAAKDSNVTQALIDRFAPGTQNHGKGTKKEPGWFYGFKADVWQAYALAVTYIDLTVEERKGK